MAKYYVQSGNSRTIVHAEDAQGAALWVVHQALQGVVPALDEMGQRVERNDAGQTPSVVLSGKIRLSERGFDRPDADSLDVYPLVAEWAQLMTALNRLDEMVQRGDLGNDSLGPNCATAI